MKTYKIVLDTLTNPENKKEFKIEAENIRNAERKAANLADENFKTFHPEFCTKVYCTITSSNEKPVFTSFFAS